MTGKHYCGGLVGGGGGGEGVKTTENKIHWPPLEKLIAKLPIYLKIRPDSWTVSSGGKSIKAYWTSGRLHIVGWLGLGKENLDSQAKEKTVMFGSA
jgi:hypothetical protein